MQGTQFSEKTCVVFLPRWSCQSWDHRIPEAIVCQVWQLQLQAQIIRCGVKPQLQAKEHSLSYAGLCSRVGVGILVADNYRGRPTSLIG